MKQIDLFSSKDFERKIPLEFFGNGPQSFGFCWTAISETCSALANAKLNDWLKSAVRVYGGAEGEDLDIWSHKQYPHDTHMALVVCIEELQKKECEHEPIKSNTFHGAHKCLVPKCAKCGAEIKPSGWKAVE